MKILRTATLMLSLFGLAACPGNAGSYTKKNLADSPVPGGIHFKESRESLSLWESSPQLKAWVSESGISAAQREARIEAAQSLGRYSKSRDTLVYISRDVNLSGSAITSLPDGLVVSGDLNLSRSAVGKLDIRLVVRGNLNIEYTTISVMAPSVRIDRDLIANDTGFTELTTQLNVGGDVYLNHTPLTKLADGLVVQGSLLLRGSPLTNLPQNLRVGGTLDITHCPIATLPADLQVTGDLIAVGTQLTALPPRALFANGDAVHPTVRTIDLRDTDIGYDAQAYLRLIERTDLNILLGSRYGSLAKAPPEQASFLLDDYIAAYRSQLSPAPQYQAIDISEWRLSTDKTAILHALFRNLYEASGGDGGPMAERVLDLFAQLQTDVGSRQDVIAILGDTPCTSPKAGIALLEKAELTTLVAQVGLQATGEADAKRLGIRMLHLQTVHRFANEAAKRYSIADVRRAEQTFEVSLRSYLGLQTLSTAPTGPLCSVITPEDIGHAAQAALDATGDDTTLATFLQTFAPYQRYLRKQLADSTAFEAYKNYAPVSIGDAQMLCPLTNTTLSDLGQPVAIAQPPAKGAQAAPYEFAAVLQWWWQTGTAPLSDVPMDLSSIRPVRIEPAESAP